MWTLTDEKESRGNAARLREESSCCRAKLHFAEVFKMISLKHQCTSNNDCALATKKIKLMINLKKKSKHK